MRAYTTADLPSRHVFRGFIRLIPLLLVSFAIAGLVYGGVNAAPRADDGTALAPAAAASWALNTPTGWATSPVAVSATAVDADLLDETTAEYSLCTDGSTWGPWLPVPALQAVRESPTTVRMTVTLTGLVESPTNNRVQFRLEDDTAALETSPAYTVPVDNFFPGAPTGLAATPSGWTNLNSFALNWTNPTDVSGIPTAYLKFGAAPTGPSDYGRSFTGTNVSSASGITLTTTGAVAAYVWLQDGAGHNSYASSAQTTLYLDNTAPGQPVGLAAAPASWSATNSFNLSWTNPVQAQSPIARAYFKLGAAPTGASDYTGLQDGANIQALTGIVAPGAGTTSCYVWLGDAAGNSNYISAAVVNLYYDATAPTGPVGLSASPASWTATNLFDLTWTNPTQTNAPIARAYWKFTSAPTSSSDYAGYRDAADIQALDDLTLPTLEATACYVWLQDAAGNANYGSAVSVVLYYTGGTAPGAPIGLQVAPSDWTSANTFDVTWTNPVVPPGIQAAWYRWNTAPVGPEDGVRQAGASINRLDDLIAPDEGQNTLYVWLEDGAGVKDHTRRSSGTARYDATAPATTHSFVPVLPASGWFTGTVSLQLSPSDAHSGVATTYHRPLGDLLWKTGTAISVTEFVTYTWKSVDNAGNEETPREALVPIDTVPPTTTLTLDPPVPASGWYTGTVAVELEAVDDRSGWADDSQYSLDNGAWVLGTSFDLSANGKHSLRYYSRDVAGNVEATLTSDDIQIDAQAPTITATLPSGEWLVPPVTIALVASDAQAGVESSGIAHVEFRKQGAPSWIEGASIVVDGTAGDGPYTYEFRALDVAGNVSAPASISVKIDGTPPGQPTALAATPSTWVNTDGGYGATWTNPAEVSGIAGAYFKLDVDPIVDSTPTGYVAAENIAALSALSVITDGAHSLYVWLEDSAGNSDPYMRTALLNAFKLDRAAPTLSAPTLQGPLGEDGLHYRGPVTVTLAASDTLSGLSAIHYQIEADPVVTVPIVGGPASAQHQTTLFFEGARKQMAFWATDAATNEQTTAQTVALRFDSLAPTAPTGITVQPATWTATNSFTVSWTNPADYSGIASAYYKRGSAPTAGTDGTKFTLPAFGETSIAGIALSQQGETPLYLWLKDQAGNVDHTSAVSTTLRWDGTAPATQIQVTGTLRSGYYITPLTVRFTSTDAASGVVETRYRVNGGAEKIWSGQDVVISKDGTYTISYYSVDAAGNIEASHQSPSYKVDLTAPRVLLNVATDYVTESAVLVRWAGDDGAGGSGVSRYTVEVRAGGCGVWQTWLTDTVSTEQWYRDNMARNTFYYFRVRCVDQAGHQSQYSPASNNVVYREGLWNGSFNSCTNQTWYTEGALGASVGRYTDRFGAQNCMGLLGQVRQYTDRVTP
ncbi:MAG: hypothetical protein GX557_07020, partial [Chloroflexi bacterium]|nr:hypothetical protein [Chloroflexota bacterium]